MGTSIKARKGNHQPQFRHPHLLIVIPVFLLLHVAGMKTTCYSLDPLIHPKSALPIPNYLINLLIIFDQNKISVSKAHLGRGKQKGGPWIGWINRLDGDCLLNYEK